MSIMYLSGLKWVGARDVSENFMIPPRSIQAQVTHVHKLTI